MTTARFVTALLVAASIGGCASIGAASARVAGGPVSGPAADELALLRLAEKVDAAGRASSLADP